VEILYDVIVHGAPAVQLVVAPEFKFPAIDVSAYQGRIAQTIGRFSFDTLLTFRMYCAVIAGGAPLI
jgi:hypothetical protein